MNRIRLATILATVAICLSLPTSAAAADAPNTCSSAVAASPQGSWVYETIGSATDVDWYRFDVAVDRYVLLTLGRLAADYDLYLYRGCTTQVASSHRSGRQLDEIYQRLTAGIYYVRVVGYDGASSPTNYALRFKSLAEGMQVLSYSAWIDGSNRLHIPGEVLNNTSANRRYVSIEAQLQNSSNTVVGRAVGYADRWIVPARSRSSFEIITRLPAGYHHSRLTVSSVTTSAAPFPSLAISVGSAYTDGNGARHYPGSVKNGSAATAHLTQAIVTTYDQYGNVQRVGWDFTGPSSIAPGSSRPFDAKVLSPTAANRVVYRAQASTIGCNTGPRYTDGGQEVFAGDIPNAGPRVGLTFDMGGRIEPAVAIMQRLVEYNVCATIFPTGRMARDTAEGREVMAIVQAHPELFELGNHTMHHCDLVRGGAGSPSSSDVAICNAAAPDPSAAFIRNELQEAEDILEAATGRAVKPYWRPPYGSYDSSVLNAADDIGYTKTFRWSLDTIDWRPIADGGPTAYSMAKKVVDGSTSGEDVLMHLGGFETWDALPGMIDGLRSRGYTTTSLSDMLR